MTVKNNPTKRKRRATSLSAPASVLERSDYRAILTDLRRQIVAGELPKGGQLPTRDKLIAQYGTCSATLQRALDRLAHDGFIYAQKGLGTFVADHPPHLNHIGVAFHGDPINDKPGSTFWLRNFARSVRPAATSPRSTVRAWSSAPSAPSGSPAR